jgi:ATP-dependent protease ClpP protease subunit
MKSAVRQRARQSYALVGSAGGPATLYIYGEIGESGVTAARVAADIEALGPVEKLTVRVSSYGGDAMEGVAINSLLRSLPYDVEVVIDGIAASAASVIAVAGRRVLMPRTALMMIHDPWAVALGDAEDMRRQAEVLEKVKSALAAAYLAKSPEIDRDRLDALLAEETWLTAEEAVDLGLADEIVEPDTDRKAPANSAFSDNFYAAIARRLAASAAAVRAEKSGRDLSEEMAMTRRRKPVLNRAETPIEEEESARAVEEREDEETSAEGDLPEGKTETEAVAPAPEEDDNDEAGNADASAGGDDEEDDDAVARKAKALEDEEADDALALAVRLRAAGEPDAIVLARAWAGLAPSEIAAKIELRRNIRAAIATARQLGTISSTVETAALNAASLGEARAILFDAIASAQEATAIDRRPQPAGDVGLAGAIDAYEIARARYRAGIINKAAKEIS